MKLSLGRVVATPAAIEAMQESGQLPLLFLLRHARGDWGELNESDKRINDESLKSGSRVLSAHRTLKGVRLWVITEAIDENGQRPATTILLPEEY